MMKKYTFYVLLLIATITIGHTAAQAQLIINTVAGDSVQGMFGDNGPAYLSVMYNPSDVTVDRINNVYISDMSNNHVRRIDAVTGLITTVAGVGAGFGSGDFGGDNALAVNALLDQPEGIALDTSYNLYICDYNNARIRKVTYTTGIISTIAGTGSNVYNGDNIPALSAQISPKSLALDAAGNIYFCDYLSNRIRKITLSTGLVTTIAGDGTYGFFGDNGPAISAQFRGPAGIAIDTSGNIFIADKLNNRIRKIDAISGIITTIVGTATPGSTGDNGPASAAQLNQPVCVSIDAAGNLLIADKNNYKIRKVDAATGIITTVAGNGTGGFSGDGGLATNAGIGPITGVTFDHSGNLFLADAVSRVRSVCNVVTPTASISATPSGSITSGTSVTFTATPVNAGVAPIFHWTKNGATVGTNSSTYIDNALQNNDTIKCYLYTYNTCTGYDTIYTNTITMAVTTGISSIAGSSLHVYPNPTNDVLHIDNIQAGAAYHIVNMIGATVQQGTLSTTNNTVSLQKQPAGIYILQLTNKTGQQEVLRIVKQ